MNTTLSSRRQTTVKGRSLICSQSAHGLSFGWMKSCLMSLSLSQTPLRRKGGKVFILYSPHPYERAGLAHCSFSWGYCLACSQGVWNKEYILSAQKECCSHESAQRSSRISCSCPCSERSGSGWQTAAGFSLLQLMGKWIPSREVPKGNSK